jgi:hypothetical protein
MGPSFCVWREEKSGKKMVGKKIGSEELISEPRLQFPTPDKSTFCQFFCQHFFACL